MWSDFKKLWDVEDDTEDDDGDEVDPEPPPPLHPGLYGVADTKISLNTEIIKNMSTGIFW